MSFVIFVVNEIKVIVPGYPHRSLKSLNFRARARDGMVPIKKRLVW